MPCMQLNEAEMKIGLANLEVTNVTRVATEVRQKGDDERNKLQIEVSYLGTTNIYSV